MPNTRSYRAAVWAVGISLAVLLLALVYMLGYISHKGGAGTSAAQSQGSTNSGVDFSALDQILGLLQKDYFGRANLDPKSLYEAAVRGMLDSLSDAGTYYVDPITNQFLPTRDFAGIGATVILQGQNITIVSPRPGSPAEQAGIKPGDLILEVDGVSTKGWTVYEAVLKIRGQKGTTVKLKIQHQDGAIQEFTITRDDVLIPSVSTDPPGGPLHDASSNPLTDLAYMHILVFKTGTPSEVEKVAGDAQASGKKGLIIDLREDLGGLLQETLDTTDIFLNQGVMLGEVDRDGNQKIYRATPGGAALNIPIVLLVDEFSASGAEVLTAALKDNGRATVIGKKTFGKGTVNTAEPLKDGGALYVSILHWLTPKGVQIDKVGITPDIEVTPGPRDPTYDETNDMQLARAIQQLETPSVSAPRAPVIATP
jgi:carboxyl-terminal processing protease